jgi:hypothetical protein
LTSANGEQEVPGESLQTLRCLVSGNRSTKTRQRELLKNPESFHSDKWYMAVPPCFNDALDIRKINSGAWTQGSMFSFRLGDTLHSAFQEEKAGVIYLKTNALAIQIAQSSLAYTNENGTRAPGSILFDYFTMGPDATYINRGSHRMTQDDFIRFLIVGPDRNLTEKLRPHLNCQKTA